jgi:hypothetical protein
MKKVVFFLNLTAITIFFVLFFSTGTHADCTKDVDCKRDRVCEKGICVDQGQKESSQKKIIAKDGRFIAYEDGTVLDTWTNLMWAVHDNRSSISWYNAKSYCENYRGGGYTDWRMPTQDELARLYDNSKSYKAMDRDYNIYLTELIKLSACCPWASDTRGSDYANFCFTNDARGLGRGSFDGSDRALPVRNGK